MGTTADDAQKAFMASVKKRYIPGFKKDRKTVSFHDFRNEMEKLGIDTSLTQFNDFMEYRRSGWTKSKDLDNTYYE